MPFSNELNASRVRICIRDHNSIHSAILFVMAEWNWSQWEMRIFHLHSMYTDSVMIQCVQQIQTRQAIAQHNVYNKCTKPHGLWKLVHDQNRRHTRLPHTTHNLNILSNETYEQMTFAQINHAIYTRADKCRTKTHFITFIHIYTQRKSRIRKHRQTEKEHTHTHIFFVIVSMVQCFRRRFSATTYDRIGWMCC